MHVKSQAHHQTAEETARLTADEIFDAAYQSGRDELRRSSLALTFSGLIAGLTIGLTPLVVGATRMYMGGGGPQEFAAKLLYPIGFVTVIIGRSQLFTENTLYPVVVVLRDRSQLLNTFRLWAIVYASNLVGALLFALIFGASSAVRPEISTTISAIGERAVIGSFSHLVWSGVVGGWLLASIAWLVSASHWTTGQVAVVWVLTLALGLGDFTHCIVGSTEILTGVVRGTIAPFAYLQWLGPATLGNVLGGIILVTLLNYGQVTQGQTRGR